MWPCSKEGEKETRWWQHPGHVMKRGHDGMRHQCSQQALSVLPQSFWLGSLLQFQGCLHCGGPQTLRCLFAGQSGSVISFPACLALRCSSTAQHHQPISALDEKRVRFVGWWYWESPWNKCGAVWRHCLVDHIYNARVGGMSGAGEAKNRDGWNIWS